MRNLRQPTERLIFDLEYPNEPSMERSIGVSSANFEPSMSTKFMFGLQNGIVISGSRKVKTNAEKLSLRFNTYNGVVRSVDRNIFSPKIFLTVSKTNTRIWAEDTREGSLITIRFFRHSVFRYYRHLLLERIIQQIFVLFFEGVEDQFRLVGTKPGTLFFTS